MKKILIVAAIHCFFVFPLLAQNPSDFADYKTKYKDKDIVFLKIKHEITVNIVKSELEIKENRFEEIYYNNYKAGAFSDDKIKYSQFDHLENISASTLLPDKDKFKEIKVKEFKTKELIGDEVFYEDLFSTSFTFPSLREGAITRVNSTFSLKEPRFFPHQFVMRFYPVEDYEFIINADKNVDFEIKYFHTDSIHLDFTKIEKGGRIYYTWKAVNLKGYKTEEYAPDIFYYLPLIVPYIKTFKVKGVEKPVLRNIGDLVKWYRGNIAGIDSTVTPEMKSAVADMTKDCTTDMQRVKTIYKWVQANIKYVANEYGLGGFVPRSPKVIFEKRYGDCKDMASILVGLLRIAGVKAYYTWVGTNELPFTYEELPTSLVDNHMIATYIANGKHYFLDATNHHITPDFPSTFIQGKETLILKEDSAYEIATVPVISPDLNIASDTLSVSINGDKLEGKGNARFRGYYFTSEIETLDRIKDNTDKEKHIKQYLEKGSNKFNLKKYDITSTDTGMAIAYSFDLENYVNASDDEIYVNLNLTQPYASEELLKDDRTLDYEMTFMGTYTTTVQLDIPKGYKVTYLPKNNEFTNDLFSHRIHYQQNGNGITYTLSITTKVLLMKKPSFAAWNSMLKQIRGDYKEAIVLKKGK